VSRVDFSRKWKLKETSHEKSGKRWMQGTGPGFVYALTVLGTGDVVSNRLTVYPIPCTIVTQTSTNISICRDKMRSK